MQYIYHFTQVEFGEESAEAAWHLFMMPSGHLSWAEHLGDSGQEVWVSLLRLLPSQQKSRYCQRWTDGWMNIQENNPPVVQQCYLRIINAFSAEIINITYHVPINVSHVVL